MKSLICCGEKEGPKYGVNKSPLGRTPFATPESQAAPIAHPALPATGDTNPVANPAREASASTSNALNATPPPKHKAVAPVFSRHLEASATTASSSDACKAAAIQAGASSAMDATLRQSPAATPRSLSSEVERHTVSETSGFR